MLAAAVSGGGGRGRKWRGGPDGGLVRWGRCGTLPEGMHTAQGAESWARLLAAAEAVRGLLEDGHPITAALANLRLIDRGSEPHEEMVGSAEPPPGAELFLSRIEAATAVLEGVVRSLGQGEPVDTQTVLAVLYGRD